MEPARSTVGCAGQATSPRSLVPVARFPVPVESLARPRQAQSHGCARRSKIPANALTAQMTPLPYSSRFIMDGSK